MPFYDFRCDKCGHKFDVLQSIKAPNPTCPKEIGEKNAAALILDDDTHVLCGSKTTKLISKGSFHLKGGGWADDGYS